jgi:hypothetical protein
MLSSYTWLHSFLPINAPQMFTYFYAHIGYIYVYILLWPYVYNSLHTSSPLSQYMSTYCYAHISIHKYILLRPYTPIYMSTYFYDIILMQVYILLRPYICTCLHTATPIDLHTFRHFCAHIHIQDYKLLRPYTYTWIHITTPIYVLCTSTYFYDNIPFMFTYFHGDLPIHVSFIIADISPMHIYILLRPYTYICLHTLKL